MLLCILVCVIHCAIDIIGRRTLCFSCGIYGNSFKLLSIGFSCHFKKYVTDNEIFNYRGTGVCALTRLVRFTTSLF